MVVEQGRGFEVTRHEPGVAVVTFNQPERLNGMTLGMKRDLIELVTELQFDDDVRVVVFIGTGRAFCAGDGGTDYMDEKHGPELVPFPRLGRRAPVRSYGTLRTFSQGLNRSVRELDKLTIAALNGFAIQSGLSLALACDFRIASTDARLGSATLRMGFLPDEGGHWLLVQYLGVGRTIDFVMRQRIVSAEEALELGLVNEVVAPDELMIRTLGLAEELANGPQVAMRMLKHAVYHAAEQSFDLAGHEIAAKTAVSDYHEDAEEGRAAFWAKRPADFNRWLED